MQGPRRRGGLGHRGGRRDGLGVPPGRCGSAVQGQEASESICAQSGRGRGRRGDGLLSD